MQNEYVIETLAEKSDKSLMFTVHFKDEPDLLLAFDNVQFVEDKEGFRIDYEITGSFMKGAKEKSLEYIQMRAKEFLEKFLESAAIGR